MEDGGDDDPPSNSISLSAAARLACRGRFFERRPLLPLFDRVRRAPDREGFAKFLVPALLGGGGYMCSRRRMEDGVIRHFEAAAGGIQDEDGRAEAKDSKEK